MNGIRIKIFFPLVGFLSLFSACANLDSEGIDGERFDYILIRDNLFQDQEGDLYFRTIDRSATADPINSDESMCYVYNNYLYVDSLIGDEKIIATSALNDMVDRETFHKLGQNSFPIEDTVPSPLGRTYYADKNNSYVLIHVSDGGVLHKKIGLIKYDN